MANKRINYKLKIDDEAAKRSIDELSKYMSDSLGKAAAKAMQDAFKASGNGGGSGSGPVMFGGSVSRYRRDKSANGTKNEDGTRTPGGDFRYNGALGKSFNAELRDVSKNLSALNTSMNRRNSIIAQASKTGHMSYNQNIELGNTRESVTSATSASGGPTFRSAADRYKEKLAGIQNNTDSLKATIATKGARGLDTRDEQMQIQQNDKLAYSYQKYIEAINDATNTLKSQPMANGATTGSMGIGSTNGGQASSDIKGISVDPKRGSFAYNLLQRSFAIGARATTAAINTGTNMYQQGKVINRSTGQQALEMGSLVGGLSDQQVREQVQSFRGQYGYTTQQGLDFYEQAIRSRGKTLTASQAKDRVGAIEDAGRASGLREQTYSDLLTTASGAGAVNSDSDIKNIVQTVLAANSMSGNAGNKEQNTQTLTNLISSISASRSMTAKDIRNTGVVQSSLSSSGGAWQGQAGENNLQNVQNSFTSASMGQNNALQYLIMRQNGIGGVAGAFQARLQAEKGLSDVNNVRVGRQLTQQYGTSKNGKALAAMQLQNLWGISASGADEFVKSVSNGNLSDSEIQKRVQKADKKGSSDYKKGSSDYKNSQQSTLNESVANIDANASKMASDLNKLTEIGNNINHTLLGQLASSVVGNVIGGAGLISGGGGAAFKTMAEKVIGRGGASTAAEGATSASKGIFSKATSAGESFFSKFGAGSDAEQLARAAKYGDSASFLSKGASGLSKGASALSKGGSFLMKGLSKAALPLAIGAGAISTISDVSKAKTSKGKAEAAGGGIGSTLLSIAGAAGGGALAGSVVPGPGTLVGLAGGLIGGIGGAIAGSAGGKWIGGKANDAWDWITGKDDKTSSKSKIKTTQAQVAQKEQQSMLDKWQKIMDQWTKNIKDTDSSNNGSSSSKSSSKSHKAFGGIVKGRTEIAEGNRPEVVVPTDPAKQSYTKSALTQVTEMTGIRATDDKPSTSQQMGAFSPNITINNSGNGSTRDDDALAHRLQQALQNATNDYRFNYKRSY